MVVQQVMASGRIALSEELIAALRAEMRGPVIVPGDPEYDGARRVWNALIDKYPAVIARCTGVADVVAAVTFAREHQLPVAIRGGGHNVAGTSVCDDGLVIDFSLMKGIRVDPEARTVRAEPGVTWGELDRETQLFGLATPGGEVSVTGIAGLTLGGGIGHLRRKHGLSCDNLTSVDLVLADGRFVRAHAEEHADIFWGVRGGGGNLGVVTSFEFRLHPVGPEIYEANIWYPMEQAPEVMRAWRQFTAQAPDEATTIAMPWNIPAIPDFPEELHGLPVLIVGGVYAGPVSEGERVLRPLGEMGAPLFDLSGSTTYYAVQAGFDSFLSEGLLCYWKSVFVDDLDDAAINAIIRHSESRPSPMNLIAIRHMGGAVSRVGEDETAYANRGAQFLVSYDACWTDPVENDDNIAWSREAWAELQAISNGGVYVNFAGFGEEGQDLLRSVHGPGYERLVELKRRHDPTNLFSSRLNVS